MTGFVMAPWTDEQVERLRARQGRPDLHPYTCAPHGHTLSPTTEGWVCFWPDCEYEQGWAHAADAEGDYFMAPHTPFEKVP